MGLTGASALFYIFSLHNLGNDMGTLARLFLAFLKVGVFGYGGGPAMIPLVQEEVVDVHAWLTPAEFTDALAMGNSLPGPIIVKMSVFIG